MKAYLRRVLSKLWLAGLTRPGLNFIALLAQVGGAAVLTTMLGFALYSLISASQWEPVSMLAYGLLVTVALVIWGMGRLLAGKQAIELELWKVKAKLSSEGDD